ncbi:MAG: hypothetical protein IKG55_01500 [Solobacterium sp.]|nr:hypothetical protein [Solobacterium sp.]
MDKWTRTQDLVEDVFGKRPESPEALIEYMIVMADMLIESNEYSDSPRKTHSQITLRN